MYKSRVLVVVDDGEVVGIYATEPGVAVRVVYLTDYFDADACDLPPELLLTEDDELVVNRTLFPYEIEEGKE